MKLTIALAVFLGCATATAFAQDPSTAFDRGRSLQSWQNSGLPAVLANCQNSPRPFSIGGGQSASA